MSSEKRKPVLAGTGFLKNIDVLAGKIDDRESTPNLPNLQASPPSLSKFRRPPEHPALA